MQSIQYTDTVFMVHGYKVYSTRILYSGARIQSIQYMDTVFLVHGYKVYSTRILYYSARIQSIQYMDTELLSARIHSIQYTDTVLQCTDTKYTIHGYCTVLLRAPERNTRHENTIYFKCINTKRYKGWYRITHRPTPHAKTRKLRV